MNMKSRGLDPNCPRCMGWLFSAYTHPALTCLLCGRSWFISTLEFVPAWRGPSHEERVEAERERSREGGINAGLQRLMAAYRRE
jgi:hypothetical protein